MFTQYTNYARKNVGTTAASLVICPVGQQLMVNQLSCANVTNFAVTCSVTLTRGANTVFIVNNATVYPGGSLLCAGEDQKIVLMAGDDLRVQSSLANSIDAMVSGVLTDSSTVPAVPGVVVGTNATISVAPSVTTVEEGGTVTFTVNTSLPNGTVIHWENIGTTNPQDFTDDRNSGSAVVSGGVATFTRTLRSTLAGVDIAGEGSETIIMGVGTVPIYLGGGVLAAAATVTVLEDPVTAGLIMYLDAGNPASYAGSGATWTDLSGNGNNVLLQNSPTFASGALAFNGTTQWARSVPSINLTAFDSVTVEIAVRANTTAVQGCAWEHTADWNANPGAIGLFVNSNGSGAQANVFHTNHNTGPARNYESSLGTGWAVHTNVYSRISDATGRLTYVNGQLVPFSAVNGYATGTATTGGSFANSLLFFGARGGSGSFLNGRIMMFRIYNRKLSASEIFQNYQAIQNRLTNIEPTISTAVASGVTFDAVSQVNNIEDIEFSTDGTRMYLLRRNNSTIFQYTLSTPWAINSAVYASKSFSVSGQIPVGSQLSMSFSPDGLNLYAIRQGSPQVIYQYTMTVAGDLATATYSGKSFNVGTATGFPCGLALASDGRSVFTCDPISDKVDRYLLSTAWDISTASLTGRTFRVLTAFQGAPQGVTFYSSTSMYVTDQNRRVYQYRLSVPWDVTTAGLVGSNATALSADLSDIAFHTNGTRFYTAAGVSTVTEYSV